MPSTLALAPLLSRWRVSVPLLGVEVEEAIADGSFAVDGMTVDAEDGFRLR